MAEKKEKEKKKKNRTEITSKNGKQYNYVRITRKVGSHINKRGLEVGDYKQFTGKTMKEAIAKYEKYMRTVSLDGMVSFDAYYRWFVANVLSQDDSLKPQTKIKYQNDFERAFGGSPLLKRELAEITGIELQQMIKDSPAGATTVRQAVKLLRRFYKYLDAQRVCHNVTQSLILPKVEHRRDSQEIEIYSDEELDKLLNGIPKDHRLRLMVVLAIRTGCRVSELLALTYSDVQGNYISISKTLAETEKSKNEEGSKTSFEITKPKTVSSIRTIPIKDDVLQEIAEHRRWHEEEIKANGYEAPYIFTSSTGNFYYKKNLERALKRLCEKIGVEHRGWHAFRRSFGTRLARSGCPVHVLCKLMGHKNIQITAEYYIGISDAEKESAIAALEL